MSGSGRENVSDVRDWSVGPPGCPGVVGRTYLMSESGQETLLDVWECSEVLSGRPGVIGRTFRTSRSAQAALTCARESLTGGRGAHIDVRQ